MVITVDQLLYVAALIWNILISCHKREIIMTDLGWRDMNQMKIVVDGHIFKLRRRVCSAVSGIKLIHGNVELLFKSAVDITG